MDKIIVKNTSGSSKAWDHFGFYKVGNTVLKDKAVCRICKQECKYTGGTTNLNQHLHKYHSDLFNTNPCASKQPMQTQITSMMKQPVVKISQRAHQMYAESIAEFVCGDLIPLSTVDSQHFRSMIKLVSGGAYEPPHRKYIMDTMLPKMYKDTVQDMKKEIGTLNGIGLTTDAWTSLATESYISYTVHYITDDWSLKSKVLSTQHSAERHTAENLAKDMEKTEQSWGLDKLLFNPVYVHDNASNITKAPSLIDRLGIGCLAHAINLAACSATSIDQVSLLLAKGRKLVGTFKRSTLAANVLKVKQSLLLPEKNYKLLQDCPTRWNSSYDMLERLNELSEVSSLHQSMNF